MSLYWTRWILIMIWPFPRMRSRTRPLALRSLDVNGDGALDAEECGKVFAGDFMRINPVLNALDANHDGLISGSEIRDAAAALERLDSNHDGRLTAEEFLPDPLLNRLHELLKAARTATGERK